MNESLERSFGLVIAYLVPGFVCLLGISPYSPTIASWLAVAPTNEPTFGSFLYVVLSSLTAGLIVTAFRWAIIDTFHHYTGLRRPALNFSKLEKNIQAFEIAVEHNYRYYQFFGGMTLASLFYAVCNQTASGIWPFWAYVVGVIFLALMLITSRECLKRFYERTGQFLGK